jgi:ribosome recycling factor
MAYDFSKLKKQVQETEEWLTREFGGVRTGRATPTLLDAVRADVYGTKTPISQLANLSIEDSRTLRIVPWDKSVAKAIEKAIGDADLGVSVAADDVGLRVAFPSLTAERRTMLAKIANDKLEQAKVTLRGHRSDTLKEIDAAEKEGGMSKDELARYKAEAQKLIDGGNASLETLGKKKAEEIAQ